MSSLPRRSVIKAGRGSLVEIWPMPATARNRAGYPQPYTRNDLLAERRYADLETMTAVAACTIDGRVVGKEPIYRRGPSIHERRLALKDAELEMAARALVKIGERDIAFETGERPDWRVTLSDGRLVGVEVTEVNPSADLTNRVIDLEVELNDAIDARGLLTDAYAHTWFGPLAFTLTDEPPATQLNAKTRRNLRTELLDWLASGNLASGRIIGYTTLERFQVTANVGTSPGSTSFEFGLGATSFASMDAYQPTLARIGKKFSSAVGYNTTNPLWLVLSVTDMQGVFTDSVNAVGRLAHSTGAFERIIVTDGLALRVLDRS